MTRESRKARSTGPQTKALVTQAAKGGIRKRGKAADPSRTESTWAQAFRRIRSDKVALVSFSVIVLLALVAVFSPLLTGLLGHAPNSPYTETGLSEAGIPVGPNDVFWLGTDFIGRDLLARLIAGTRVTMLVSVVSALAAIVLGTTLGTIAGYFGGRVDLIISGMIDFVIALPFLIIAMALVVIYGASYPILMGTIIFFTWSTVARIARGLVLSMRELDFVKAAQTLGASHARIVLRHILPNIAGPILTYGSLLIPQIIVMEASLSYLGLGAPPPEPTWGGIVAENQLNFELAWWSVLFPALALLLSTLAFNLLGDSLRDALDPSSDERG